MKAFFAVLLLSLAPHRAWACAVCFGEAGQDLQRGFYWGILLLLLLPFALVLAVTAKIVLSIRRKASNKNTANV